MRFWIKHQFVCYRVLSILYMFWLIIVILCLIMVLTIKIINHSFTDLIIESDNLELFKLYAVYNKSLIAYISARHGAIKIS